MLSGLKWDWVFAGIAVIFGVSAAVYTNPVFLVGSIYAFSLAVRLGSRLEGREGIPLLMLLCLLYVVETTPVRNFTGSMIHTLHALILFRALLIELQKPSLLWVIPITLEFGIHVVLVYASIKSAGPSEVIDVISRMPARLVGVAVGVQLWLKFKNSLNIKRPS